MSKKKQGDVLVESRIDECGLWKTYRRPNGDYYVELPLSMAEMLRKVAEILGVSIEDALHFAAARRKRREESRRV